MDFIVAAATDIGLTKKTNQDSYCVRIYNTLQGKLVFAILCDGMGGLAKGEVASASVISAFLNWADTRLPELTFEALREEDIRKEWTKLAVRYNEKIKYYGACCGVALGTTLTAILLCEDQYFIINVGDSRAYEISDTVRVLTKDQSFVAREIELGHMTLEEAKTDPRRNVLLQCIGASDEVVPDFYFGKTKRDTVYMLCSDGFRHEVSNDELLRFLQPRQMLSEERMENRIVSLIELNKQRKERDNITAVCVKTS